MPNGSDDSGLSSSRIQRADLVGRSDPAERNLAAQPDQNYGRAGRTELAGGGGADAAARTGDDNSRAC